MKRKLFSKAFLAQSVLAIPAAALMLGAGAAHAGTIGLNFQDNWYPYNSAPYGGATW